MGANDKRATSQSQADATSDIVDGELHFSLRRPGPGWKLLHRADADMLVPGAVAGALSPSALTAIVRVVKTERDVEAHIDTLVAGLTLEKLSVLSREDGRFSVTGESVGVSLRYDGKAFKKNGAVYELIAWSPIGNKAPEADAFFDNVSIASGTIKDLPATIHTTGDASTIGEGFVLRKDMWRNFEHGVSFQRMDGWSLFVGTEARAIDPQAQLLLKGAFDALLIIEHAGELGVDHLHAAAKKRLAATLSTTMYGASKGTLAGNEARISYALDGNVRRARIATMIHGEAAVSLCAWTKKSKSIDAKEVEALAKGLELNAAAPVVEAKADVYRDNRLGFELRPPAGWAREDITPRELAPLGSMVRWQSDGRWFAVAAAAIASTPERHPWIAGLLEQHLRDVLSPAARGEITHKITTFADHPAVRLSWPAQLQQIDAIIIWRDAAVYALIAVDNSADAWAKVTENFKLID